MIKLCSVDKSFDGHNVFNNFSLELKKGERYCLMGESGVGKTTLLNMLLGLIKPDRGELFGIPNKITAVFQEDRLCEDFSAVGNIAAVIGNKIPKVFIKKFLCELGLEGSEEKKVIELSGGMRRRVAIARALICDSEMLIMDEPFKGLDSETKKKVVETVLKYTEGKTLVVATHDIEDISLLNANLISL